jgi:hypothetical protein
MRPTNRRAAWIALCAVVLVILGIGAFWVGAATDHRFAGDMPMHVWGIASARPGRGILGLLGLLGVLALIGVGIGLVVSLLRRPDMPPAPPLVPPPPPVAGPAPSIPGSQPARPPDDVLERVRQLAAMHDQGVLTDEEFAAAKRRLLGL